MKREITKISRQSGLGIVGVVLAIIIILIIASIGIHLYTTSTGKLNVGRAGIRLTQMIATTQKRFQDQGNFAGVSAQVLIDNAIPDKSMIQGGKLVNAWNQQVTVNPYSLNASNDAVEFVEPGVPADTCAAYVDAAGGSAVRILVGGTTVKDLPNGVSLNPAALGSACAGSGNKTIHFIAGRL